MKKLLLTAGICLSALVFVQAQQTAVATTPDQQVEKMMTNLTTACKLSADQVTKAKPIVTEFVNAKIANKQKLGSDKDKMKAANQASMKAMNTKLNTVLNADQQKQLAAYEKEKMAEKQKGGAK
jgi:hypothetical protein